jgi:outer membrane protein assembly factor BamE (lipoprotein component of BamABCDE complex)
MGPSTNDFQFDQKSSSMVNIQTLYFHNQSFFFVFKIDQFMVGHGFNSEIAQNKTMSASFDNNLCVDNLKSQQISSNQSTSSDISLGKKVIKSLISLKSLLFSS